MAVSDGTYRIGSDSGHLVLRTSRTGMGRRAGHDLRIEAARWTGEVTVSREGAAGSAVSAEVEVASLEVREGTGGLKPLTDADRSEIEGRLREILDAERHPSITVRSSRVTGEPGSLTVDADLTIRGTARPITISAELTDDRVRGTTAVRQSQWGIKPYSAFLGALKLADEVTVEFDAPLTPAP